MRNSKILLDRNGKKIETDLNGKVVYSTGNILRMTYWQVLREWCNYTLTIKHFFQVSIFEFIETIWQGVLAALGILLFIILFPILPFIKAYSMKRDAKEFMVGRENVLDTIFKRDDE